MCNIAYSAVVSLTGIYFALNRRLFRSKFSVRDMNEASQSLPLQPVHAIWNLIRKIHDDQL